MTAQLSSVEAVEEDRSTAALRVSNFSSKDRRLGGFVAALTGEVGVAQPLDENLPQSIAGAGEDHVAGRIGRAFLNAKIAPLLVDHPLGAGSAWLTFYGVSQPVSNLTRITVDGSNNANDYLRVTVNHRGQEVLSWTKVPFTAH